MRLAFQVFTDKDQWQQISCGLEDIGCVLAVEEHLHLHSRIAVLGLEHHLSASAARCTGFGGEMAVGEACDSQFCHGLLRILCACSKQGRALCAQTARIGCVLLVTTTDHFAVRQLSRCAHMKTAIRAITALRLLFGNCDHRTLFIRQFVPLIGTHFCCQIVLFHCIFEVKFIFH